MDDEKELKLLGELGLGTSRLKEDGRVANEIIQSISEAAQNLGNVLKSLGESIGAANALNDFAKNIETIGDKIGVASQKAGEGAGTFIQSINLLKSQERIGEVGLKEYIAALEDLKAKLDESSSHIVAKTKVNNELAAALKKATDETLALLKAEERLGQISNDEYMERLRLLESEVQSTMELAKVKAELAKANESLGRDWFQAADDSAKSRIAALREELKFTDDYKAALQELIESDQVRAEVKAEAVKEVARLEQEAIKQSLQGEKEARDAKTRMYKRMFDELEERRKQDELAEKEALQRKLKMYADMFDELEERARAEAETEKRIAQELANAQKLERSNYITWWKNTLKEEEEGFKRLKEQIKQREKEEAERQKALLKEKEARQKAHFENLKHLYMIGEISPQEYKAHLDNLLALRAAHADQIKKIEVERHRVTQQLMRQELDTARAQGGFVPGSKLDSVSSYAISASLVWGSARLLRDASNVVKDIERETIDLQRVTSMTNDELKVMREHAMEVAVQTGRLVTDVQKVQNLWARMGDYSKEAIMALTETTDIALNIAEFGNVEDSVMYLNAAINQFGLDASEAGAVLDSWAKIADRTAVRTAKDLAEVTMRAGSNAKMLGLNFHELNAITAILTSRMSRSGEEIGTALRTIFTYLQDDKTIKTLEKYGVQVKKNEKEYRDFTAVLMDLNKVYQELERAGNKVAIHEIDTAIGRVRRVDYVQNMIQGLVEFDYLVEQSMDSVGFAAEQNAKVMESLEGQIRQFKAELQELAYHLGEAGLLDFMKSAVAAGREFIGFLNDLSPPTKSAIATILALASAITMADKAFSALFGRNMLVGINETLTRMLASANNWIKSMRAVNTVRETSNKITMQETVRLLGLGQVYQANTAAQLANVTATRNATAQSVRKAAADTAGTRAIAANTLEIQRNTQAQNLNNAAKAAGARYGGLFGSVVAGLSGPLGWLTLAVTGAWSALTYFKRVKEENIEKAKQMAAAEQELADILRRGVVSSVELPGVTERYEKMKELNEELLKLEQQRLELQQKMREAEEEQLRLYEEEGIETMLPFEFGDWAMQSFELEKSIEKIDEKLRELGTTSKNVGKDLSELNAIILFSSEANAQEALQLLEVMDRRKLATQSIKNQLQEAQNLLDKQERGIELTLQEKQALDTALETGNRYISVFGNEFAEAIETATDIRELNIRAILDTIDAQTGLNVSQLEAIARERGLSEEVKRAAIDIVEARLKTTQAAYLAAKAEHGLADERGRSLTKEAEYLKTLRMEISKLQQDLRALMEMPLAEDLPNILDIGDDIGGKLSSPLRNTLSIIDEYNAKIANLKIQIDLLDDTEEGRRMTIIKTNEILDLLNKKQQALNQTNNQLRASLEDVNRQLAAHIAGWMDKTVEERIMAINSLSVEHRENIAELISAYNELTSAIRNNGQEWWRVEQERASTTNSLNKMIEDQLAYAYRLERQVMAKRLQDEHENKVLQLQMRLLGQTQEDFNRYYEERIAAKEEELRLLDEQIKREEYLKKLREIEAEMEKVRRDTRFSYIDEETMTETYTYDRARYAELERQRQELIEGKATDDRREALRKEIEDLKSQRQERQNHYDESLRELEESHRKELDAFNLYWEERLSAESLKHEVWLMIQKDGYDKSLSMAEDWANKMKFHMEEIIKLQYATGMGINVGLGGTATLRPLDYGNDGRGYAEHRFDDRDWIRSEIERTNQVIANRLSQGMEITNQLKWLEKLKKHTYHDGGIVGRSLSLKHDEVIAKLRVGEGVLTPEQMTKLYHSMSKVSAVPRGASAPSTPSVTYHFENVTVHADNIQEFLDSIKPYTVARR